MGARPEQERRLSTSSRGSRRWLVFLTAAWTMLGQLPAALAESADEVLTRLESLPREERLAELAAMNALDRLLPEQLAVVADAVTRRAEGEGDEAEASLGHSLRCRAYLRRGALDHARNACRRALELAHLEGHPAALFAAYRQGGALAMEHDDAEGALHSLTVALRYARERSDDRGAAVVLAALGAVAHERSADAEATQYLQQALEMAEVTGDPGLVAMASNNLGNVFLKRGQAAPALSQFERAAAAAEAAKIVPIVFAARFQIAIARGRMGEPEGALAEMRTLLGELGEVTDAVHRGLAHRYIAEMQLLAGDVEAAESSASTAVALLEAGGGRRGTALLLLAEILERRGKHDAALVQLDALVERADRSPGEAATALVRKAEILAATGQFEAAYGALLRGNEMHLRNDESAATEQLGFLRARFEADRLDQEIQAERQRGVELALRSKKDRLLRNVAIAAALFIIGLSIVIARLRIRQRELQAELERQYRLETIGRLTGGVAHDFNNLLTVVRQSVSLLKRRQSLQADPEALELVEEAGEAARSGASIAGQLLSFSRQQELSPSVLSLAGYFRDTRRLLERTAGEGMEICIRVEDDCPPIEVDRDQLTAALINLVANARDAMDHRGRVELTAKRADPADPALRRADPGREYVALAVSDRGIGISSKDLPRVVEPFYTSKAPGAGSGVGLSMVYGFVRQSRGELQIHSDPGEGTRVLLYFPVAVSNRA